MSDRFRTVQCGEPTGAAGARKKRQAKRADGAAAKSKTRRGFVGGEAIVKKPVAAYIEKVYEKGELAGLGIGT